MESSPGLKSSLDTDECVDQEADDFIAVPNLNSNTPYIAARQSRKNKKTSADSVFQAKILKFLDTDDRPDPDTTILMSFLPKFKKLTEDQKKDF